MLRARIVLACELQPSNQVVAAELGIGAHTVGKWRNRFIVDQLPGLYDERRSGRPRTIEDKAVAELVARTLALAESENAARSSPWHGAGDN
jgi:putative transposase